MKRWSSVRVGHSSQSGRQGKTVEQYIEYTQRPEGGLDSWIQKQHEYAQDGWFIHQFTQMTEASLYDGRPVIFYLTIYRKDS